MDSWEKKEKAHLKRVQERKKKTTDDTQTPRPKRRMQPDDADMFLKLACALKIIMAQTIKDADMPRAKHLLFAFLLKFLEV